MTFGVNAAFVPLLQISIIQAVLADINMKKGESECQYYIDKMEYLDERQKDPHIEQCKSLLCHGELRNKSGTVSLCLPHRHTQNSLNYWGQITFVFYFLEIYTITKATIFQIRPSEGRHWLPFSLKRMTQ